VLLGSTGAATFAWTRISGANADLTGANTARASFTMPAGVATDQVTITAQADQPAITRSGFRADQSSGGSTTRSTCASGTAP
jgi:hypothetical protein